MPRKEKRRITLYLYEEDLAFLEELTPPEGTRYPSISFVVRQHLHEWVKEKREKGIERI